MTTVTTGTGFVLWLTGLEGGSAAGLVHTLEAGLRERGHRVEVLDFDEAREHLGQGLGYSRAERDTIAVRMGWVAGKLAEHGVAVLVPVVSSRQALDRVRDSIPTFVEILVEGAAEPGPATDVIVAADDGGTEVPARRVLVALELRGLTGPDGGDDGYSSAEEDAVAAHLRDLGYLE
jgi:adenylylsulfate kinase